MLLIEIWWTKIHYINTRLFAHLIGFSTCCHVACKIKRDISPTRKKKRRNVTYIRSEAYIALCRPLGLMMPPLSLLVIGPTIPVGPIRLAHLSLAFAPRRHPRGSCWVLRSIKFMKFQSKHRTQRNSLNRIFKNIEAPRTDDPII